MPVQDRFTRLMTLIADMKNLHDLAKTFCRSHVSLKNPLDLEIIPFYNRHNMETDVGIKEVAAEFTNKFKKLKKFDWFSSFLLQDEMNAADSCRCI